MITVEDIALLCMGKNTFSRGQLIYKVKNVKELNVKQQSVPYWFEVNGVVKGTNVEDYNVSAMVDERDNRIAHTNCNCIAFQAYAGICKHCVAMFLEYLERRDGTEVENPVAIRRYTDAGFSKILEKFANQKNVEFLQPEWFGRVSLIPELKGNYEQLEVSFRVGADSYYVVKNLKAFVQEVHRGERVRYGKNLDFYNVPAAYTPESRKMLQFIMACVTEEMDMNHSSNERYIQLVPMKSIGLKGGTLDELMELLMSQNVAFSSVISPKHRITIRDGMPKNPVRIIKEEDGIFIHTNRNQVWYGRKYAYMLEEDSIYRVERAVCENLGEFVNWANAYGRSGIFVAKSDIAMFVRHMLPEIEKLYPVDLGDFDRTPYDKRKARFKIYLDTPQANLIACKVIACYGSYEEMNIFEPDISGWNRDLESERLVASKVSPMFDAFDPEQCQQIVSDEGKIYELLTEGIGILQMFGEVFVSDELKKISIRKTPQMQLGISMKGDFLEMQVSGEELSLEELAEILSRYDRRKKYYRLKNGDFLQMGDNEDMAKFAMMTNAMRLKPEDLRKGTMRVPKYRALYLDESVREFSEISYDCDVAFRRLIEAVRNGGVSPEPVPESMDGILREYQKDGYRWMMTLKKHGFGAVLADDMGLGKTLQAIAVLQATHSDVSEHPSLIVCPASLVYNWNAEIGRFAPGLHTVMVTGNAVERQRIIRSIAPGDIVITSYDLMKRDVEFYEEYYFACQIIDEAQYIKNHNTQVAKAVKLIGADFKLALTGTPVENRLSELWSIFDYIMPGFLYTYGKFREEIETPIVLQNDKPALENLQRMITPFVLRRLKKDVLEFLPDKIEKNMYVKMDGEQLELYQAHVQRMRMLLDKQSEAEFRKGKIQVLAELTKLRQICCNPALIFNEYGGESAKTQMCMELIKNAIGGGHRILLFSQFTTMLEVLQDELDREHIEFLTLTGSTSKERRASLVEEFNEGQIPVFCISLKAGGTGLNLTAADIVIHYDPWWNVAVENQATDRAHRIGQKKVVTVYKLIAKDSIEEGIVELQEKKRELADQILASDNIGVADITREQLMALLGS